MRHRFQVPLEYALLRNRQPRSALTQRGDLQCSRSGMPNAKTYALAILAKLDQAQTDLMGKCVILTDGKAGTVEKVWLDELHGLRISIAGHDGKWPVSPIRLVEVAGPAPPVSDRTSYERNNPDTV